MRKIILPLCLFVVVICSLLIWLILAVNSQPKIAYVKSVYLAENYNGTKEAYKVLQKKVLKWQMQLDSLKEIYETSIKNYQAKKDQLKGNELKLLEKNLILKQRNFERYQGIVKEKEQEEDSRLTTGVYAQIDSYLKAYAKKEGYDLVIGANSEGTILYGSEAYDITEDILKIINQNYKGGVQ